MIEEKSVRSLTVHPDVEDVPVCTKTQRRVLTESIAEKGVLEPLVIDEQDRILDGRHRYSIALELGIEKVRVDVRHVDNPTLYAVDAAVRRRNITKTAQVYTLLKAHPDLRDNGIAKRSASLKKGQQIPVSDYSHLPDNGIAKRSASLKKGQQIPVSDYSHLRDNGIAKRSASLKKGQQIPVSDYSHLPKTMKEIANEYCLPREYFVKLNKLLHARDIDQEELRKSIFEDECSVTRLAASVCGRTATKGKKRSDPDYADLSLKAGVTLKNAFLKWPKLKWRESKSLGNHKDLTLKRFREVFEVMPDELKIENIEAIKKWPEHQREMLIRELKESQGN
jgi:hypothetical protein